jgi:multiple sugar transport system substrate-binding protein
LFFLERILKYLKEKKMKKSIVLLVLIMVFSISIFAFAEKTVVEFWTTDNEKARVDVQEAIAADFMKLHPEIEVKVIPVDEVDVPKKLVK